MKLETFPDEKNQAFKVTAFDKDQKKVGEISSEKTDPNINLTIEPQKTYYIMLDLTSAPIQSPHYKLHISFN